jgi:thiol-disulfide isomerase/thioredoxin
LVLTTAALQGASAQTSLLLLTYAAGAAASLGLALWAGGRFLAAMKRSLGLGQWVRRGMGVAVLAAVTAVALGWDTGLLAGLSSGPANSIEENLLQRWYGPQSAPSDAGHSESEAQSRYLRTGGPGALRTGTPLPVEGTMPELAGATGWLNSAPLTAQSLRGKVVLIDFWTFACINCRNALPYVRAWADKYKDQGLVVIGVHTPELPFERNVNNVKRASGELGLGFPIAIDNNYAIWRSFSNRYWPAHYFVDAQGRIRYHHFGEGAYERSEQVIRQLLEEARQQGAQQKV